MIALPSSVRVFVALEPIDMRAGMNTLHALVADRLKEQVLDGALFAFTNKRRALLKVLYWDGTGLWIMTKRLEQGTFHWPSSAQSGQLKLKLDPAAFRMLVDGIDMHKAQPRGWYERG